MNNNRRTRRALHASEAARLLEPVLPKLGIEGNFKVIDKQNYEHRAVYPILTVREQSTSRSLIHQHALQNNKEARDFNKIAREQRSSAEEFLRNHPDPQLIIEQQKKFEQDYSDKTIKEYNRHAVLTNKKYGEPRIPLKNQLFIHDTHETLAAHLLWEYSAQLRKSTKQKRANNLNYSKSVPPLVLNSQHLLNTMLDEETKYTDRCKRTIKNRKKRLLETGILITNTQRGNKKGTLNYFNPDLIVFLDGFDEKITITENQAVNSIHVQKLHDTVITTRALLEKDRNRKWKKIAKASENDGTAGEDFFSRKCPSDSPNGHSTRAPSGKPKNSGEIPRGKSKKFDNNVETGPDFTGEKHISARLLSLIVPFYYLAYDLFDKKFTGYRPLSMNILHKESVVGTLANGQFAKLLILEFFKQCQNLYPKTYWNNAVWLRTMKMFENEVFKTFNGHWLTKEKAFEKYFALVQVLTDPEIGVYAKMNLGKWKPLKRLDDYLDPKNKNIGSFAYYYDLISKNRNEAIRQGKIDRKERKKRLAFQNERARWRKKIRFEFRKKKYHGDEYAIFRYVEENVPIDHMHYCYEYIRRSIKLSA